MVRPLASTSVGVTPDCAGEVGSNGGAAALGVEVSDGIRVDGVATDWASLGAAVGDVGLLLPEQALVVATRRRAAANVAAFRCTPSSY